MINFLNKINWKVRIKNKAFWMALIPALLLLAQAILGVFGYQIDVTELGDKLLRVVNTAFGVLVIIGVVNDPTVATLSDSAQALEYSEPKKDEEI